MIIESDLAGDESDDEIGILRRPRGQNPIGDTRRAKQANELAAPLSGENEPRIDTGGQPKLKPELELGVRKA